MDLRVILGLVLMLAALLGGASVIRHARQRVPVLAAAATVQPGQVISDKDLRVIEFSPEPGVATVSASERASLVGKVAAEPLYPGKLLTARSITSGPPVPAGYVAMSLAAKSERAVAGGLRSGDRVAIVATSRPGQPDARSLLLFPDLRVLSVVTGSGAESDRVIVTVMVRPEEARMLAEARHGGEVDFLLLPGGR
jgi:Flp pilus assembly protein CpaB